MGELQKTFQNDKQVRRTPSVGRRSHLHDLTSSHASAPHPTTHTGRTLHQPRAVRAPEGGAPRLLRPARYAARPFPRRPHHAVGPLLTPPPRLFPFRRPVDRLDVGDQVGVQEAGARVPSGQAFRRRRRGARGGGGEPRAAAASLRPARPVPKLTRPASPHTSGRVQGFGRGARGSRRRLQAEAVQRGLRQGGDRGARPGRRPRGEEPQQGRLLRRRLPLSDGPSGDGE